MTSLAFIFGVVPLVWATGAGAELRQALGTAVFAGMIEARFGSSINARRMSVERRPHGAGMR
jgi:Cu/Ag efflux pump CusA